MSYEMLGHYVSRWEDSCYVTDVMGAKQMYDDHICWELTPDLEEETSELCI